MEYQTTALSIYVISSECVYECVHSLLTGMYTSKSAVAFSQYSHTLTSGRSFFRLRNEREGEISYFACFSLFFPNATVKPFVPLKFLTPFLIQL